MSIRQNDSNEPEIDAGNLPSRGNLVHRHRDLDAVIAQISRTATGGELLLRRLKKRKLSS
jgi:hypothetical protein